MTYAMAEANDSSTSIAGSSTSVAGSCTSTSTEHEETSTPSLLTNLRCPQPAAIARKRKVGILFRLHCDSLTAVYHLISKNIFENYRQILNNHMPPPRLRDFFIVPYKTSCIPQL